MDNPTDRSGPGRRQALRLLTSAAASPLLADAAAISRPRRSSFDFSNPADNVRAFVKTRGDRSGRTVYTYTSGRVYAVRQGEVAVPFLGYDSGLVDRYEAVGDGSFRQWRRELMHFTDLATGELVREIRNPFTGKVDEPMHGLVGPLKFVLTARGVAYNTHDPAAASGPPFLLDWRRQGADITVQQETLRRYRNTQQPDRWPLASTGEFRTYCDFLTYRLPLAALEDPQQSGPPVNIFYSAQTDWQPWMFMGSRTPGHMLWHASGFKTLDRSQLPAGFVAITARLHPGLLEDPFGYAESGFSYEEQLTARERRRGPG